MMKIQIKLLFIVFIGLGVFSCKPDDDSVSITPPRDEGEVAAEDHAEILEFLETHSFVMVVNPLNPNYEIIQFTTVEKGSDEALINSDFLKQKTIKQNEVEYTLYYLKIREGAPTEPKPTFADRAVATYRGQLLDLSVFDESVSPLTFNLPGNDGNGGVIKGFAEAITEFRGATDFTENPDGTIEFSDDFGIGAVFVPSGLGYFNQTIPGIPQYSPLVFTFQLYKTIQNDHDQDGIPSFYEDLNKDKYLVNDDADSDSIPNFLDADDDNDGIPTKDEIIIDDANGDGYISEDEITFPDSDGDGTPDYLDADS